MTTAVAEYSPQELELEAAELLPARETLCCRRYGHSSTYQSQSTGQIGLVNVNNTLNNNQVNVLSFGNENAGNSGNNTGFIG